MSFGSERAYQHVAHSLREEGPGRCCWCGAHIERYRTAGNQHDPTMPIVAAFTPDPWGAWRLGVDAVMHRRPGIGVVSSAGWSVHRCPEATR